VHREDRPVKWTSWLSFLGLGAIIGFVVWSSLDVGAVRCEVCITFEGRQACRSVDAATEAEAHQGAVTNACALISSGVTQTMACERTTPTRIECAPRQEDQSSK
jgi:hypothetical protein